jgi:hypothetical protein
MAGRWERTREVAKINVKYAQKKYKHYYDRNRKEYCYKSGQKVAVFIPIRVPALSEKFLHRWFGPFIVIDKGKSNNVYKIYNTKSPYRVDVVPVTRLLDQKRLGRREKSEESKTELEVRPNPRRSQRPTKGKPPQRFNYAIFCFALIFNVLSVNAVFNSAPPILWHNSQKPIVKGIEVIYMKVHYEKPCLTFL